MTARLCVVLNWFVLLFSVVFFAYTFFASDYISKIAREYVSEKTLEASGGLVRVAEAALDSPLSSKFVPADVREQVEEEIAIYRSDTEAYVKKITGNSEEGGSIEDAKVLPAPVKKFRDSVKNYYDSVLAELLRDLRIFSGSNIVFAAVGLVLLRFPAIRSSKKMIWFSFLLLSSVIFNIYMYIDDMSFFRLITKAHLGFSYPLLVVLLLALLLKDFGNLNFLAKADRSELDGEASSVKG